MSLCEGINHNNHNFSKVLTKHGQNTRDTVPLIQFYRGLGLTESSTCSKSIYHCLRL